MLSTKREARSRSKIRSKREREKGGARGTEPRLTGAEAGGGVVGADEDDAAEKGIDWEVERG